VESLVKKGLGRRKERNREDMKQDKNVGESNRRRKNGREGNKGKEPDGNGRSEKIR
jgi:hypothetical protein